MQMENPMVTPEEAATVLSLGEFIADAFRAIVKAFQKLYHAVEDALKALGLKDGE